MNKYNESIDVKKLRQYVIFDSTLIEIAIKVIISMKKIIFAISVRLAILNERMLLWKKQHTFI